MPQLTGRNALLGLTVAGAVAGSVYILYRRWKVTVKEADEGFSEKGSGEPLPKKVLVLGLDGAGKSCLLALLSGQNESAGGTQPTEGFNVISIQNEASGNLELWEIGGAPKVRKYWPNFILDTDLLVYLIDSADQRRFPESYSEMHNLLGEPRLTDKPFLVLANKQDIAGAASLAVVKEALGLEDVKHHRVQIIGTSLHPASLSGIENVQKILNKI